MTAPLIVPVTSPGEMRALGMRLAPLLRAGDLLVLAGPLGAGKTVLAQGIGAGLGVAERLTSPTFVIARRHLSGRLPLVHVDAYRLTSISEVDDLDLDDDLDRAVTLVEWGAGMVEQLSAASLLVRIERDRGESADDAREVTLLARGGDWPARLSTVGLGPVAYP